MKKRFLVLLTVVALLLVALAMPAFAVEGGEQPPTYGDCVSNIAAAGGDFGGLGVSVQRFTEATTPLQEILGEGTADQIPLDCADLPPGQ